MMRFSIIVPVLNAARREQFRYHGGSYARFPFFGSGVRFMLDETKRMELPAPQFREMSEFIVTFQKAPALRAPESRLQYKGGTLWEDSEDSHPEIVVQNRHSEQIENRLIKVLNYVQE